MSRASWQSPPTDVLGGTVPIQRFVARGDRAVVALEHAVAYPEGCTLVLHLAVRRGAMDGPAWEDVVESHYRSTGGLKYGVRLPGGSLATTAEHPFPGWGRPTERPEPFMLVEAGSDSSSDDHHYRCHQRLWLWPLPPPAGFELVVEWPGAGVDRASVTIDGGAVVRAARQATPFWS